MLVHSEGFASIDLDGDGVSDDVEKQLAEKFAPVLHKHPLDRQEGLADFNEVLSGHSTLRAYEIASGDTLYNSSTPPIHVNGSWRYDSFGRGSIPT